MKNKGRKNGIKAAAFALAMTFAATGCAGGVDGKAVFATLDGDTIYMDEANFIARSQQAQYDSYSQMFGEDMWNQDISGSGETFEQTVKNQVKDDIEQSYILMKHKDEYSVALSEADQTKIKETAAQFIEENSDRAKEVMTVSHEMLEKVLTMYTVRSRVSTAMVADVDTNVTDEEAKQRTYSYISIPFSGATDEEGNAIEYTEEEKDGLYQTAQQVQKDAESSGDFEQTATDAGYTVAQQSYSADNHDSIEEAVVEAADKLKEGEFADVIKTDTACYVLRLDSEFDKEATETRKQAIVNERKQAKFDEIYKKWQEAAEFTVNEKNWEKVKFEPSLTMPAEEETPDVTDATDEASGSAVDTDDTAADGAAADGADEAAAE